MRYYSILACLLFPIYTLAQNEPNVVPPPERGVYAIWYGNKERLVNLPYITGGQIIAQWASIEKEEGKYDFSDIDKQLKKFKEEGKFTTIQINGNEKPAWMFTRIPYHPEKIDGQVLNKEGTLMYWHPNFIKAYTNLLKAYANHLKTSPYLSVMVGVRMNFNSLGTEHVNVPGNKQSLNQWKTPKGIAQGEKWTEKIVDQYKELIVNEFIHNFTGINLFIRNNVSAETVNKYKSLFESGKLMLFHTSSEMEPRSTILERQNSLFKQFSLNGQTLSYAESWADAWGNHGGKKDKRWTSPSKFSYWRVLNDLNVGVSLIAFYGNDLTVAVDGAKRDIPDASKYKPEFVKAYKMAARYAGYHASPKVSPGAWVAFRHAEKNLATGKELKEFNDNYAFLMKQILPDHMKWENLINIGPDLQRFGAWAKALPEGQILQIALSELFAASLKGKPSVVRIIYYDSTGVFQSSFSNRIVKTQLTGTNTWKTLELPIEKSDFIKNDKGADLVITSLAGNVLFHMINIERGTGAPEDVSNLTLKRTGDNLTLTWKLPMQYDLEKIALFNENKLLKAVSGAEETMTLTLPANTSLKNLTIKSIDESGRSSTGKVIR